MKYDVEFFDGFCKITLGNKIVYMIEDSYQEEDLYS